MLTNFYNKDSFRKLSDQDKWRSYHQLAEQLETLQQNLLLKRERITAKGDKIELLREVTEELERQRIARNLAGSRTRKARYADREREVIRALRELEIDHAAELEKAIAGDWPPPPPIKIQQVSEAYHTRWPRGEDKLALRTISKYVNKFKGGLFTNPDIRVSIPSEGIS